jgi:hypothetical protein
MMRISALGAVFAFLPGVIPAFSQVLSPEIIRYGRISGMIHTSGGKPVAGALVLVNVRPSEQPGPFHPFNTVATTASDGTFSVNDVPAGRFAVCPAAPATNLLPPCMWEREIVATVEPGEAVTMPPFVLAEGVDFYVRVDDPQGRLASTLGKVAGANLLLAVRAPNGMTAPVPATATSAAGSDFHLLVPPDTDLEFIAFSSTFSMADSTGKAISRESGLKRTVNIPASQRQHRETVTVN